MKENKLVDLYFHIDPVVSGVKWVAEKFQKKNAADTAPAEKAESNEQE